MNRKQGQEVTVKQSVEGEYRVSYDTTRGDVTVTIALALEEMIGIDARELIPEFTEYADPDALDHLFREKPNGELRHPEGRVHLVIEGIDVTIYSNGLIELDR